MQPSTMPPQAKYWKTPPLPRESRFDRACKSRPKRILIVEDDWDIVRGMNLRLQTSGYETMEAYDGQEGVEAAVESHPDAIVLDVRMPRMDGLTALSKLQALNETHSIPVIMLSASLADRQAALDAGARYFLKKPYQNEMLVAALDNAISEHNQRDDDEATHDETTHDSDSR
ncbi:MAG TPA: response regulator [Planctomycetaceae bacterium]|nr:response regulator [Planctomycetaceae bacterium]